MSGFVCPICGAFESVFHKCSPKRLRRIERAIARAEEAMESGEEAEVPYGERLAAGFGIMSQAAPDERERE